MTKDQAISVLELYKDDRQQVTPNMSQAFEKQIKDRNRLIAHAVKVLLGKVDD